MIVSLVPSPIGTVTHSSTIASHRKQGPVRLHTERLCPDRTSLESSTRLRFLWDELKVSCTAHSDHRLARTMLLTIAQWPRRIKGDYPGVSSPLSGQRAARHESACKIVTDHT